MPILHAGNAGWGVQKFSALSSAPPPVDRKTIAQFILLGDASVQCVALPNSAGALIGKSIVASVSETASMRLSRLERRQALASYAMVALSTKLVVRAVVTSLAPDTRSRLAALSSASGMQNVRTLSYRVLDRPGVKSVIADSGVPSGAKMPTAFHLLTERLGTQNERIVRLRVIEVTESNGEFVRVRELFSR